MNRTYLKAQFERSLTSIYTKREQEILLDLTLERYAEKTDKEKLKTDEARLSPMLVFQCIAALSELKKHRPVQYILNQAHFFDLIFKVDESVLIPRSETEELVFWILQDLKSRKGGNLKVLDIGTGSGCIAIALKRNSPNIKMSAMDISLCALEVAKYNALINSADIEFIEDDILDSQSNCKYDLIISNPPYVRKLEMANMNKNVLENEPHLALFVEDHNALQFYQAIADFSKKNLNKGGTVFLEINEALSKETIDLLKYNTFTDIELEKDMQGKDRMIRATLN